MSDWYDEDGEPTQFVPPTNYPPGYSTPPPAQQQPSISHYDGLYDDGYDDEPGQRRGTLIALIVGGVIVLVAGIALAMVQPGNDDGSSDAASSTGPDLVTTTLAQDSSDATDSSDAATTVAVTTTTTPDTTTTTLTTTTTTTSTTTSTTTTTTTSTTTTTTTTLAPGPGGDGDLGLSVPISRPACDGSFITIVNSAVTPANYRTDVEASLAGFPGSHYLRTDQSCPSLRATTDSGAFIYSVYFGPYASRSEACEARSRGRDDAYVRVLSTTDPPGQPISCN